MTPKSHRWPAAKVAPTDAPHLRALTSLITAVVVMCALDLGRPILMPITLAILLTLLVAPLVELLRRLRLGQLPSVILAVLAAVATIAAIGTLIGTQASDLITEFPRYQAQIERKVERLQTLTVGRANELLSKTTRAINTPATPASTVNDLSELPTEQLPLAVVVHERPASPIALAERFLSPVVNPLETAGIVLVVTIFILLQREDLRDRLIRLFGTNDLHRATTAMDEAARRLSHYFLAQFGVNACVGIAISIGLAIIGVPGAIFFGALTGLLRFVPYVGTWIAALAALALAASGPDWTMLLWALALFVVVDVVTGQVIEPLVYGRSTGLSPVAVIVAAIFWSWIWGPMGLVLSTPLTLCLVILGRHVDRLAFFEVIFGDQPALTPPTNFYQRILADDSVAALQQAETIVGETSLVDYYDSVFLKGLQLARNDLMRGVILPEQLARMKEALFDIIDGLDDIDAVEKDATDATMAQNAARLSGEDGEFFDAAASPTRGDPQTILCVTGRGSLDDVLGTAVVQFLTCNGVVAEQLSFDHFPRRQIDEINLTGVANVCVLSLDAGRATTYLRILIRRVHQRAPAARLVLAFIADAEPERHEHAGTIALAVPSFRELDAWTQTLNPAVGLAEATAPATDAKAAAGNVPRPPLSPEAI